MGIRAGTQLSVVLSGEWQAEVLRLLEDAHLAAWARDEALRVRFGAGLAQFLHGMTNVAACVLHGRAISGLSDFCSQLERCVPGPPLERRIHGGRGVVSFLRSGPPRAARRPCHFRYYLWNDADALLAADRPLFTRLVEALAGVAAEAEFVADDPLVIHRLVLVGGPTLGAYAEEAHSACRAWQETGAEGALWRARTGLEAPSFIAAPIAACGG